MDTKLILAGFVICANAFSRCEARNMVKRGAPDVIGFQKGYTNTKLNNDGFSYHYSYLGKSEITKDTENEQQIGYYNTKDGAGVIKHGMGVYRATAKTDNLFGESSLTGDYDVEFFAAEVESGAGSMVRAKLVDSTVHIGPVGVNVGINVDTGILVNDGFEMKFVGIGGFVSKTGFQVCFILCAGFGW